MKPADLPPAERFEHGTRARYVTGCRCAPCRASNTAYYHERKAREAAALAELEVGPPAEPHARMWTAPDGSTKKRVFRATCPGPDPEAGSCPFNTYLRKDSKGGLCMRCRQDLVADYYVDAAPARAKIRALSRQHVGRRAVADAASVACSAIFAIRNGTKTQIRLSTERRILAVDAGARAGASYVSARPTWRLIGKLLEEGFTRTELARRLGYASPALQLRTDRITARNALRVAKFYRAIMAEGDV